MEAITHAGNVVFRRSDEGILYLVVSSSDGKHWVLPKGHIHPGESPEAAALRELKEEAGVTGEIVDRLSMCSFEKEAERVVVQYFLVRETGSTQALERRSLRWVNGEHACSLLTFDDARTALQEGAARIHQLGG
ncbi:MAG: NUDIX domain-containing protein [Phycisphaerales bacterium]